MDAIKSLMQPLVGGAGGSSMIDGMKLVVLGGTVETARRVSSTAWSHFVNSFFLTAHFSEEDYPYDWLMLWLSRRPEWQRSREFETTTRTTTPGFSSNSFADFEDENAEEDDDDDAPGKAKTRVVFQPTFDTTHTIYYRGHWLRVRRGRKTDGSGCEMLSIRCVAQACSRWIYMTDRIYSVVARNNTVLKQLVLQAKKEYEAEAVHRIQIYFADTHGGWRWTDSRHKRPMSSIVLNPGVKEMLVADTKDFLKSEKWYADRGIPFRRGYLLHGVPGSGKSSLIHAIAGELSLDIYTLSLSSSWISDSTLTTLMGRVPARCIVLLEDLDAAFTRSVTRDGKSSGNPEGNNNNRSGDDNDGQNNNGNTSGRNRRNREQLSDVNTLSLSGLLNALDGVAAAEGRILFATTNHLERLDPALSRPGRMDVWVEFKNASKWQAEALFRNFFPSTEDERAAVDRDDITLDPGELAGIDIPTTPASPMSTSAGSSIGSGTLWSMSPTFSASSSSLASSPNTAGTSPAASTPPKMKIRDTFGAQNTAYLPPAVEEHIAACSHSAKPLDAAKLARLAKKFADSIPDEEFSVAALQGYLLKNKSQPESAANDAAAWVVTEREMRERLKREKEAKEQKDKLDAEKKRKEAAEKAKEKADLEKQEQQLVKLKAQLQEQEAKVNEAKKTGEEKPADEAKDDAGKASDAVISKAEDDDKADEKKDDEAKDDDSDSDSDGENVPPPPPPNVDNGGQWADASATSWD
ncbi:hypothetical protein PLICRDRAFT_491796 [Plicaturopsis crispa FD-325 SS-3]|nr:hypothetical protein PLICRDRAFT_491796 [Plicaturopsis crispa FD-325 SS-3]